MTTVRTERVKVPHSQYEKAERVRRCARAMEKEVSIKDLSSMYTHAEIDLARAMIAEKKQ